MSRSNLKGLTLVLLIALFVWSSSFENCSASQSYIPQPSHWNYAFFNVLEYGAKGNGYADDTKAFEAAWVAACKVEGSTMVVPYGFVFLVKPITFSGPNCQPNIQFQLDGKIIAPTSSQPWGSGLLQWLQFKNLKGITILGKGVIDGQGSAWWNDYGRMPSTKPTALRFYGSKAVTVSGITIQNSARTHLKFDNCIGVQVFDIRISAPADSPNTDGIHLQNSQDVTIYRANLACGDDCISIQTGCSNIYIHNINCGPGHGISIGALGAGKTKACVSNIIVRDVTLHNTLTGVRIKTWQEGSGNIHSSCFVLPIHGNTGKAMDPCNGGCPIHSARESQVPHRSRYHYGTRKPTGSQTMLGRPSQLEERANRPQGAG
nr:polygalacturonase At1g48100-like [Quercus suber]